MFAFIIVKTTTELFLLSWHASDVKVVLARIETQTKQIFYKMAWIFQFHRVRRILL